MVHRHPTASRKEEIVKAARELIVSKGIQAVTIKNLALKNKITEGAIYRHFKNKHSILRALVEDFENNLIKAIHSPIKSYRNPIERLKNIMLVHMEYTEKRKAELFAITASSIHFNDSILRQKILDVIERYKDKIKNILLEAQEENLIRKNIDLDSVSLTFFGLVQITAIQYALTGYKIPPIKRFEALWNIFLKGIM